MNTYPGERESGTATATYVAQMSHIYLGSEMTEVSEAYGFRGRTMIDRDGDKIGKIDDVYEDKATGRPEWALVHTGLFGTKKTFVPLHDAQPTGEDVRVPLEKSRVKDAPSVDPDGELSESEERQLYTPLRRRLRHRRLVTTRPATGRGARTAAMCRPEHR